MFENSFSAKVLKNRLPRILTEIIVNKIWNLLIHSLRYKYILYIIHLVRQKPVKNMAQKKEMVEQYTKIPYNKINTKTFFQNCIRHFHFYESPTQLSRLQRILNPLKMYGE